MRSPGSFSLMTRLLVRLLLRPFAQAMAERNALVEDKALAAPAAFRFRNVCQIFENTALEVIDLGKALRDEMRARLLAADAAGAEHRDPAMLARIKFVCGKLLEGAKIPELRVERAFESAERHFEDVARVDHER